MIEDLFIHHEAGVLFFKKVKRIDTVEPEKYKSFRGKKTSCLLMSNGWINSRPIFITNCLVNNLNGTTFLELVDTFAIYKSIKELFKLASVIKKILKENVTQVITNNAFSLCLMSLLAR